MTITLVSQSMYALPNTTSGTYLASRPQGIKEGDLLIAVIGIHSHAKGNTSISGWSKSTLKQGVHSYKEIHYKVATNNEPGSYTVSRTTQDYGVGSVVMSAWRDTEGLQLGVDKGSPGTTNISFSISTANNLIIAAANNHSTDYAISPNSGRMELNGTQYNKPHYYIDKPTGSLRLDASSANCMVAISIKVVSNPPSAPGKPTFKETHYLSGEEITVSWDASTSNENDVIKYKVELYDDSEWKLIGSDIAESKCSFVLPSRATNITTAKLRVSAIDKGGTSASSQSDDFKLSSKLLLIQSSEGIKTYKNGSWQII